MAHEWAAAIDIIHPHLAITGEHIILHLIKLLWTYFLNLWKIRNTHLHHTALTLDLLNYKQAVETLYAQKHEPSPRAQEALFKQLLQQVLELPPPNFNNG